MFFLSEAQMPEGVGFKLYDTTHLAWLGFFILLCAASVIIYRKLNAKCRNRYRFRNGKKLCCGGSRRFWHRSSALSSMRHKHFAYNILYL